MKLLIILGSVTPPGRLLRAMQGLVETAQASHQLATELINLADKRIAFADGRSPEQYQDDTAALVSSAQAADALVLATPVYRGSITGALKNLLDHFPVDALIGKPIGVVAMGATAHHYLGADWHLRDVLAWFGALVVPTSVYLSSGDFVEGQLNDAARQDLSALLEAVVKLSDFRSGGGNVPGPRPLAARRN